MAEWYWKLDFGISCPLRLENICRINLLFRLEEYPVEQLRLLPITIRWDLSQGLSLVDILHYEAAGLFHDFDTASIVESARRKLLDITFGARNELTNLGFVPSILPALVPDQQFEELSKFYILEHIKKSYLSLPFTVKHLQSSPLIFPNRFISIVNSGVGEDRHKESHRVLLQYCHLLTAPKEIKVDVGDFTGSPFWVTFGDKLVEQDPVIPALQSFLSQVETIQLKWFKKFDKYILSFFDDSDFFAATAESTTMQATSYVLLYNIVTNEQPCLKHIKIYGIHRVIEMILTSVEKFCSACQNYFPSSPDFPLKLATPPPGPYLLNSFTVTQSGGTESETDAPQESYRMDREYAENISSSLRAIILFQLHSLEHLSINLGTNFCYGLRVGVSTKELVAERNYSIPEYRQLLSTLFGLLKQPQLRSLTVGRAPLNEAYQLIKAFLCTEANHSQSLTIEGVEEESKWIKKYHKNFGYYEDSNWIKEEMQSDIGLFNKQSSEEQIEDSHSVSDPAPTHPLHSPPAQALPDSNGALKSLDIGYSCDRLHAWLFSIPNLQLKELKTSRPDLVPISGVTFVVIDTSV